VVAKLIYQHVNALQERQDSMTDVKSAILAVAAAEQVTSVAAGTSSAGYMHTSNGYRRPLSCHIGYVTLLLSH
jgi:hypothetical protein